MSTALRIPTLDAEIRAVLDRYGYRDALLVFALPPASDLQPAQPPSAVRASCARVVSLCGVSPHMRGSAYLEDALVLMAAALPVRTAQMSVYAQVAQQHNTTANAVERAMRNALEYAARYRSQRFWAVFDGVGRDGDRPSNGAALWRLLELARADAAQGGEGNG